MKLVLFIFILLSFTNLLSQEEDTLAYTTYRDKIVLYSDLGFSSAPFTIKGNFADGIDKLKYRHNQKFVLGFGVAYKWFAIRFGFALPGHLRPESRFGKSNYQDLGLNFNIKQTYWDLDIRNYYGYALKNAYKWNDTLNALHPNSLMPNTRSVSVSINTWYFRSKEFKMASVLGKKGDFKRSHGTWYFKGTFNFFGSANDSIPLMPQSIVDTSINAYRSNAVSALDIGVVPGYAYVHRWKHWQASVFGGLGGVLQAKIYGDGTSSRGFVGLAPRLDLRFVIGYSKPRYFLWLQSNFDVKSIRFKDVSYRQNYNTLQLIGGIRLDKKKKEKKKQ